MPPEETCAQEFFSFIPPPYALRDPPFPPPESFLHFPDTHLDENLILKRICVLPSLIDDIFTSVDTLFPVAAQLAFEDAMYHFSRMPYPKSDDNYKTQDVRNPYTAGIASASLQLVSGIIIHPNDPYMDRIVGWQRNPYPHTNRNTPFHDEDFVLKTMPYAEKDFGGFSPTSQERIRPIMDQFPVFALGMLLCPNGEWCLEEMDELVPAPDADDQIVDFPWLVNSYPAGHPPTPSAVRPPDAENPLWHLPETAPPTTSALRTSKRPHNSRHKDLPSEASGAKQLAPTHFRPKDIRPAPPRRPPSARDLLQRAWFKAVRYDVSVILFDCGNLLRIGIRHRQTQTLYLTPIVDVGDPYSFYSKLMLGMHLCIFHDVFERVSSFSTPPPDEQSPSEGSNSSRKRSGDHLSEESPSKRRRTAAPSSPPASRPSSRLHDLIRDAKDEKKKVPKDLRLRTHKYFKTHPVLALYIRYGTYNSPTPEVLLSPDYPRSKIYKAKNCLPLILTAKLGRGATGKAYTAVLGPGHERVPCSRLVAKIADTRETLMSLRHEYDVYCHLQAAGVTGIPYVFGYYQDDTRGLGALVMHNVGNPLGRRMDGDRKIKFSATEKHKTLKNIHSAGVLHRDLRSWNMMYNGHGEVFIIDFDRASFKASEEDLAREFERLARFLEGEFVDRDSIIGSSNDMPSDIQERIANADVSVVDGADGTMSN
ncbi:hypothetical protein BDZ89DRAFT_1163128 [Hymenopellis radicata]|nr:hypothetical protein BDZ89DRAFT_1163128 [Hymenopellis radicata]